jgi:hypothetical protein
LFRIVAIVGFSVGMTGAAQPAALKFSFVSAE